MTAAVMWIIMGIVPRARGSMAFDPDSIAPPPSLPDKAGQLTLSRRVEEASLNAWPSLHQLVHDGWLIRFAGGFTKRANSVVPLYPAREPLCGKIEYCERLYAERGLRTIFRLTTLGESSELDLELASRGYQRVEPTRVMWRPLESAPAPNDGPQPRVRTRPGWLKAYAELSGMPGESQALHSAVLKNICLPCIYMTLDDDACTVGCALGVVDQALLGLFDVVTHAAYRGVGHGERLVRALLGEGHRRGARQAYLQVLDENAPAERLYARLGFLPLYRYWYRIAP
jgi:N-acetylglutamate synthase